MLQLQIVSYRTAFFSFPTTSFSLSPLCCCLFQASGPFTKMCLRPHKCITYDSDSNDGRENNQLEIAPRLDPDPLRSLHGHERQRQAPNDAKIVTPTRGHVIAFLQ